MVKQFPSHENIRHVGAWQVRYIGDLANTVRTIPHSKHNTNGCRQLSWQHWSRSECSIQSTVFCYKRRKTHEKGQGLTRETSRRDLIFSQFLSNVLKSIASMPCPAETFQRTPNSPRYLLQTQQTGLRHSPKTPQHSSQLWAPQQESQAVLPLSAKSTTISTWHLQRAQRQQAYRPTCSSRPAAHLQRRGFLMQR